MPNPGAALSLSFSLSLSPHSDTSASPALSLCKPSLFTLTAPFLLDFTSHTLECFETTHTLAFTPVFRILSNFCGAGSDRNVVQLRSSFGEFFDPKSPPNSDGPLSNPRLQVSNSDPFFVASTVLKVKALRDRL